MAAVLFATIVAQLPNNQQFQAKNKQTAFKLI
jgi:hypothetical protein